MFNRPLHPSPVPSGNGGGGAVAVAGTVTRGTHELMTMKVVWSLTPGANRMSSTKEGTGRSLPPRSCVASERVEGGCKFQPKLNQSRGIHHGGAFS